MRVFLAGASGAIGRPLVDQLLGAGHEVIGTTRSEARADDLRARGAEAVVLDAFDAEAVHAALAAAQPEILIHQLTALPARFNTRRYAEQVAETNRLREETAPVFIEAARAAGARRAIFQSVSFITRADGPAVLDESAPLDLSLAPAKATAAMEDAVTSATGIDGLVLRYGFFYGRSTHFDTDGSILAEIRRRRYPIIGPGTGITSFVHIDDAARATVLAMDHGAPGIYNIVDDEPAALSEWLPELARIIGARAPRRIPAWLARLVAGDVAVHFGVALRGASNAKARRELGWEPHYPSWRAGFAHELGASAA
jgi:nucleoside-diphosphate-sugar epimerase